MKEADFMVKAIILFVFAFLAGIEGFSILANAKSAIHESEAFILLLIVTVSLCGAFIVMSINELTTEVKKINGNIEPPVNPVSLNTEQSNQQSNQ